MMRETADDLEAESEILDIFAEHFGCSWTKLGSGGKYRIDAILHKGHKMRAWVEVKDYKSGLFLGLNVPKYQEGMGLAADTEIPFLLVFRHEGKIGYIKVHEGGMWSDSHVDIRMAGGTPPNRPANDDDYEPMVMFRETYVIWLK